MITKAISTTAPVTPEPRSRRTSAASALQDLLKLALRLTNSAALVLSALAISGCALFTPYEASLNEGNLVREEALSQVTLGQTPEQVGFLLGTPLLTSSASQNVWLFPIQNDRSKGIDEVLAITFENGLVSKIERRTTNKGE